MHRLLFFFFKQKQIETNQIDSDVLSCKMHDTSNSRTRLPVFQMPGRLAGNLLRRVQEVPGLQARHLPDAVAVQLPGGLGRPTV